LRSIQIYSILIFNDVRKRGQGDGRKSDRRPSPRGVTDRVLEAPRRLLMGWGVGTIKVCRCLLLLWRDFAALPFLTMSPRNSKPQRSTPSLLDMGSGSRGARDSEPHETCITTGASGTSDCLIYIGPGDYRVIFDPIIGGVRQLGLYRLVPNKPPPEGQTCHGHHLACPHY
jgi:hypothetical protein